MQSPTTRAPIRLCARMVLPHAPVPTAIARASPAACICLCIAPFAPSPDALQHAPRDRTRIARRLTLTLRVVASPHALPHARRADRPIKKKTQGKRNLPANEAVSRWLIIETLESVRRRRRLFR